MGRISGDVKKGKSTVYIIVCYDPAHREEHLDAVREHAGQDGSSAEFSSDEEVETQPSPC